MKFRNAYTPVAALGGSTAPAAPIGTWLGHYFTENDALGYSVFNANLGTPAPNRRIVIAVAAPNSVSSDIVDVQVNYVTATRLIDSPAGTRCIELWEMPVPNGTIGDIVVNISVSGNSRISIAWWAVYSSAGPTSTSGTLTSSAGAATTLPMDIVVPTGGFGIAYGHTSGNTAISWSQTSGTGDIRHNELIGSQHWTSSYDTTAAGSQQITITVPASTNLRGVAAAWGP